MAPFASFKEVFAIFASGIVVLSLQSNNRFFVERTFCIIGKYCPELEEINFTCMLLLNGLLHEMTKKLDCSKLKRINMNCSFNHYCAIHDGLSALYKACPRIESLNISRSLNARVQDCAELWPPTLREVYINHAWALTSYSLWSLVKCCPKLALFSMCGNQCGMDGGLKFVFSRLSDLLILYLNEYPGDSELGVQIGQLRNLCELHLSGSSMVNDEVIRSVAEGCKKLEILDIGVPEGYTECTRYGVLTDEGLLSVAYHLPGLKNLNLQGRTRISDYSLSAILSNGGVEILALASSDLITDNSLCALGACCSARLRELRLSRMSNVSSSGILDVCKSWFLNCCYQSGYNLLLHLDEVSIDINDFLETFQTVTENRQHEFILDPAEGRPRRTINLYCDVLITLFYK